MSIKVIFGLTALILLSLLLVKNDYKYFVIQSGSMEPSYKIGDLVLLHQQDEYNIGDVITFKSGLGKIVTHRISNIEGQAKYLTKGDANRVEDFATVDKKAVIGKVIQIIPSVGLLNSFVETNAGFLVFFLLPAGTSIAGQVLALVR